MILSISHLPTRKAPGPDGLLVELYKKLTSLHPYLLKLLNDIYRTGAIPAALRDIYIVPITKQGKDPRDPQGERPISLLNSTKKILEGVVYQRLLPRVETQFDWDNMPIGATGEQSVI